MLPRRAGCEREGKTVKAAAAARIALNPVPPTRWLASVRAFGSEHHIGVFGSALDAARAHDIVARALFHGLAKLNFPYSHYDYCELPLDADGERRRVRLLLKKLQLEKYMPQLTI